jgi:hypothetical protein
MTLFYYEYFICFNGVYHIVNISHFCYDEIIVQLAFGKRDNKTGNID